MRRVLMDRARNKQREKRGGRWERIDLEHVNLATEDPDVNVLAVNEALEHFAVIDPVKAEVVKLRYFVGLNYGEIADALNLAEVTVRRYWALARAWLYAELKKEREAE
jgi:RNA polymerase sigma factor (TIGR02999 family)